MSTLPAEERSCEMLVADMRDAKRLSSLTFDGLLPIERQRVLSLLGTYYRAYDALATYTAFANGRIDQLREVLQEFMAFQISDYDRVAGRAKDYCAIRRRGRELLKDLQHVK